MEKIIGFNLTKELGKMALPPWLGRYPRVRAEERRFGNWVLKLWGYGDFDKFIKDGRVVIGYSDADLAALDLFPLQNRGVLIEFGDVREPQSNEETILANDALGMLPVFYGNKDGVPYVSTCEECVIRALGGVTLGHGRLASYLIFQMAAATLTLWNEIDKLYANSFLAIGPNGHFKQTPQLPLQFAPVEGDPITRMEEVLTETVRRYTDPLGDVFLPLSHGHDSRLVLAHMQKPERVHARTFPLSHPAERAFDVMVARASARMLGVEDHQIVDLGQDQLRDYTESSIELLGTPLAAVQVYIQAFVEGLGMENGEWPVVTGMNGDEHAGVAIGRSKGKLKESGDPAARFESACYCWVKAWQPGDMDACLAYDWRTALKPVREIWARIWEETEGDDLVRHAHLIHTRNRGSQYLTYAWQGADLHGGFVGPIYDDRRYVEFMLSLPEDVRDGRLGQILLFNRYYPGLYPMAGVEQDDCDWLNRLDIDALMKAKDAALWPLAPDGTKPAHDFLKPEGVRELYARAVGGDLRSYYLLNSLQPLAWAIEKGYVR